MQCITTIYYIMSDINNTIYSIMSDIHTTLSRNFEVFKTPYKKDYYFVI